MISVISDLDGYNNEMRKPLADKAFFSSIINPDIIVDFGCADGLLITYMREQGSNATFIGYDISEQELSVARKNLPDVEFFSSWDALVAHVNTIRDGKTVAVVCNSVIHEVYSYASDHSVADFWAGLRKAAFDYVVIRDMLFHQNNNRIKKSEIANIEYIAKERMGVRFAQFVDRWGGLGTSKTLLHFLLKYRYVHNWSREVEENYLSYILLDVETELLGMYDYVYRNHFILPFIREQVKNDFDYNLRMFTHWKAIYKLRQPK